MPLPTKDPHNNPGGAVGYTWEGIYAHKDQLGGAGCTFVFYYVTDTFEEGPPHKHNAHQLIIFTGGDPKNIRDFDAEIEIALGDEQEIQTITSPAVVSIPPGLTHCPLRIKRLTKPILFFEMVLEKDYQRVAEDGKPTAAVYVKKI